MAPRVLVQVLRELAQEQGIQFHTFSHGWIVVLEKQGVRRRVFGYDFDLNDAVAQMLAKDKSATARLLSFYEVPCVEHRLFLRADNEAYAPLEGNWPALLNLARGWGYPLVCKPNAGSSGQGVFLVRNARELEWVCQQLFREHKAIAVAPYYDIPREYRAILLDGEPLLVYEKRRPEVVGDGRTPLGLLLLQALGQVPLPAAAREETLRFYRDRWHEVPQAGQKFPLIWRHNLAAGARPVLLDPGHPAYDHVVPLARRALAALGLRVAAVDVVYVQPHGEWRVLEVNAGIMMEYFSRKHPQGRELARRVYAALLQAMFAETPAPAAALEHA